MTNQNDEVFGEPIYVYTSNQAVEDGILLDVKVLADKIKDIDGPRSPIKYITTNLLTKYGYMREYQGDQVCGHTFKDVNGEWIKATIEECPYCYKKANEIKFNYPNLIDLLNQALHIIKRSGKVDHFYAGKIETPDGTRQQIFIVQNETGKIHNHGTRGLLKWHLKIGII